MSVKDKAPKPLGRLFGGLLTAVLLAVNSVHICSLMVSVMSPAEKATPAAGNDRVDLLILLAVSLLSNPRLAAWITPLAGCLRRGLAVGKATA